VPVLLTATRPALGTLLRGARARTSHLRLNATKPFGETMLPIGPTELIVLLVIALIVVGPKRLRLPQAGRALGRGVRGARDSARARLEQ
jgi:hypothetical protein